MRANQLIECPQQVRPHIVLLGAGASRAAFPDGDLSSRPIPLMNDIVDCLELRPMLDQLGEEFASESDFELIYSRIVSNPEYEHIAKEIEKRLNSYFSSLELPDEATIYDRLLLFLRPGDAVLTFNWDPFLFDAYVRNSSIAALPGIFFLHGNVRIGKCLDHVEKWGRRWVACPVCSKPFKNVPLLYPIGKKDYSKDPYIEQSWKAARELFREAFVLTIFGYSAPDSDRDAVDMLKAAWMGRSRRKIEHIEVIDIEDFGTLYERWKPFTPTFHLTHRQQFDKSWIARWPRRSREAVWFPAIEGEVCEEFSLPPTNDLDEIQERIAEIARYET